VYTPEEVRKKDYKLALRARIGYLIGYQSINIYRIWMPQQEEVRPEKNVVFNEAIFFDSRELDEPEKEVVTTLKIPILPTIPPGGFISEDLEEGWTVGDSEPSSSSSSSETAPQPQKSAPPLPAPVLPTPRATPETPGPAGPSESSEQSREIRGDVAESNIIVGSRARKPTAKASQSYAAAFH
jgi:hypothetical protein